jgi:hypothetical protein
MAESAFIGIGKPEAQRCFCGILYVRGKNIFYSLIDHPVQHFFAGMVAAPGLLHDGAGSGTKGNFHSRHLCSHDGIAWSLRLYPRLWPSVFLRQTRRACQSLANCVVSAREVIEFSVRNLYGKA